MEQIKQEIINNIYENGENLITGPVLQTVLLDMVDDVNSKVASASVAPDIVDKTGSWDDAADWVEENSSSLVHENDLDGYATEQWVEDQGYLKEHQDLGGYATTESLNNLSESVANDLANLPEPDLSDYATKEYVEATSASVKEWVENKHYLTTASLSGSVTEESVQFMINDATSSVKTWVGDQNYATETFVSQAIAEIPGTDLTGYATEAWVEEQGYLKEHQDISGLATTESVTSLSESVAQDFANLPDVSGLATTSSVNQLSESIAQTIEDLPEVDLSGYATTESLNQVSSSLSESIAAISGSSVDLSGYATTSSVNALSESVAQTIESLPQADLSGYLQTSSYLVDSASFDSRIKDAREEATTAITNVSEGVVALSASFDQRINSITGSEADLSGYATTASLNQVSESISASLDLKADKSDIPSLEGYATEQWVEEQGYLTEHQDISGLATTSSLNSVSESISQSIDALAGTVADKAEARDLTSLSESVAADILNARTEASAGFASVDQGVRVLSASFDQRISEITGSDVDLSGYATTQSVNNLSASFAETIDNIPGTDLTGYATEQWVQNQGYLTEHQDISGLATTSSVSALSSSVSSDIQNARTEASQAITGLGTIVQGESDRVTGLSASFDNRINNITGSSVDLSGYATTQSVNALSASFDSRINSLDLSGFLFGTGSTSGSESIFPSASNWVVEVSQSVAFILDSELEEGRSIQVIYHNAGANSVSIYFNEEYWGPYSVVNGVLGSGSFEIPAGEYGDVVATRIGDRIYFRTSLDVSNIEVDLSEYATTASLNSVSQSLSASIAAGGVTLEQLQDLGLVYNNDGYWVAADDQEHGGLPIDGEGGFWTNAPAIWRNLVSQNLIGYFEDYDRETDTTHWSLQDTIGTAEWSDNPVGGLLRYISEGKLVDWSSEEGEGRWVSPIVGEVEGKLNTSSFNTVSASFDQRISSIPGSEVDLSGYATTESVNTLSASFDQRINSIPGSDIDLSGYATTESVNTLSASFAETIDNIPTGSGASGNYLPITGGTLTGNLFVGGNNSIGVGSTKVGIRSLTVGDSATSTWEAHYALAVGENCQTDVYGGVALGRETRVNSEPFGVATGFRTRVDKMSGFAGGCLSTASGQFSFAAGFGAVAKGTGQVVLGSFNEIDGTGTGTGSYAVILGNGKSSTWNQDDPGDVVRSNGLAIKWDGGIDINYSGSTITLQDKIAELEQGGGSPVDLSGYATTQSLNVLDSRVTDLSSSFDTRISQIVAASGGLDPADFAGAPTIVYQTDGTTGLVGVNHYTGSGMQYPAFDDTAWQLENLDLSNFDRIECYFKNSSMNPATVVTVILDSAAAGSGADTYRGTSWCPRVIGGGRQIYEVEVAVDTSKTKLQVPYQFRVDTNNGTYVDASSDGNYLYKIVGYPKIV